MSFFCLYDVDRSIVGFLVTVRAHLKKKIRNFKALLIQKQIYSKQMKQFFMPENYLNILDRCFNKICFLTNVFFVVQSCGLLFSAAEFSLLCNRALFCVID